MPRWNAPTLAASLVLALAPLHAAHALTQPNGVPIPSPMGCDSGHPTGLLAALACACTQPGVCNVGAPCTTQTSCDDGKHGTCETTLTHAFNDNTCIPSNHSGLDPTTEAATTPETFRPTCALTFTVVTRGTAQFKNVFGWYNVTGSAPPLSDLHPMLGCGAGAGASTVLDLAKEPAYKGGDIGFFLMTPEAHGGSKQCAGGDCCPTIARVQNGDGYVYYSERKFNPDQAGPQSFIHLLVLPSHLAKNKFYFAWEDIFGGSDDEFTDLVTSVDGVQCAGGGQDCDTGQKGACARGVTTCSASGDATSIACVPLTQPGSETCNGVDDDCDGTVDDGATCPRPHDVCVNGTCVRPCGNGESTCGGETQCDSATGLCVDPTCIGVACAKDQVCRGGHCAAPCEGVVCPRGQTCAGDACVDPCKGVACAAGQVCHQGRCFAGCAACDGIACATGLACDAASGQCVDPSCPKGCGDGTVCKQGQCVDACDGVACPRGQVCRQGACVGGAAAQPDGGSLAAAGDGPGSDGGAGDAPDITSKAGCACGVVGITGSAGADGLAAVAVAGALAVARARRRRAKVASRRAGSDARRA